jgi:hypothetical protein
MAVDVAAELCVSCENIQRFQALAGTLGCLGGSLSFGANGHRSGVGCAE